MWQKEPKRAYYHNYRPNNDNGINSPITRYPAAEGCKSSQLSYAGFR